MVFFPTEKIEIVEYLSSKNSYISLTGELYTDLDEYKNKSIANIFENVVDKNKISCFIKIMFVSDYEIENTKQNDANFESEIFHGEGSTNKKNGSTHIHLSYKLSDLIWKEYESKFRLSNNNDFRINFNEIDGEIFDKDKDNDGCINYKIQLKLDFFAWTVFRNKNRN